MKRWFFTAMLVAAALVYSLAPGQAGAYSYGDANTEDVAETYKLIESELSAATPNWSTAEEAYKVRRSEIASHFGEEVAVTLDKNLSARDKSLLIANFRAVLVMNLERRFTYSLQGISDYAATKILLAKAKATYDTLAPSINPKLADIDKAFDEALNALGNPGLFGVGKRAAQPEVFKAKVDGILSAVKPLFPYKAYVAPATPQPTPTPTPTPVVVQPEPSTTPVSTTAPQPTPTSAASSTAPPASTAPSPSASPAQTTAASQSPTPSTSPQTNSSATGAASTSTPSGSPAATASPSSSASPTVGKELAGHAPMERIDRTNPWITFIVIGGVIIAGAGAIWFARRKKWL
ncbi:hypothetical protein [Paenibacillus koleovorans]|uniref:hypothetical protein n=1 Tax=Paenibacillus koleovorans TaxID=121608 RepID=UPI000FD7217D|nr:hypothetical protein [Paenibacillus koleovorans]